MNLKDIVGGDIAWAMEALDECASVMAEEGLLEDKELPMVAVAPPGEFRQKDLRVYAAHVRELCRRWKKRSRLDDLDHPTRAEIMLGMSAASLMSPLNRVGMAIYSRLFVEIMGEDAVPELLPLDRDAWDGQVEEELSRLQRKKRPRLRRAE